MQVLLFTDVKRLQHHVDGVGLRLAQHETVEVVADKLRVHGLRHFGRGYLGGCVRV